MKRRTTTIARLGLCTALALILAYVETLFPPLYAAIPGIKMGLPNIVIIFVLFRFGPGAATVVSLVRVGAVSLLFGNPMTFAYSVAGAALSLTVMMLLKRSKLFSIVGISVSGGIFHNVGQILTAMLLLNTAELGYYMIVLAFTGTLSGALIGLCAGVILNRLPPPRV